MSRRDPANRPGELDQLTLERARRGERAALARLVERYGRQVYALVGRLLAGRRDLVDDTAQEALVKVIQGIGRFDPAGPARLSTWILTVATRCAIDALRRQRRSGPPLLVEPVGRDDPEREAGQRQLAARVAEVMASLPPDQRAVLVLRAYHDLDYGEIAAALGVETGTVKSRLGRARAALRRSLGLATDTVIP